MRTTGAYGGASIAGATLLLAVVAWPLVLIGWALALLVVGVVATWSLLAD